jgi:hypothetical protein
VIALVLALDLAAAAGGHAMDAWGIPWCGNDVVGEVARRVGCTLEDAACWERRGGFCTGHVEARVLAGRPSGAVTLQPVDPSEVAPGDVAVFAARAHYAYVEAVTRDAAGRTVAVTVSETNFGTCWVAKDLMVTDRYGVVGRRVGVPVSAVDGGFLRAKPAAPAGR